MAYEKLTLVDRVRDENGNITVEGTKIKKEHIEHIEQGILDNEAAIAENAKKAAENAAAIEKKQDTLQSGVNIKTVNGESILGEGNIVVEGEDVDLSGKQDVLVSGSNIKTVGGVSVLGGGDIPFKTINGISVVGSGDIQQDIEDGEATLGEVLAMFDTTVGKNKYNKDAASPVDAYFYNGSGVLTAGTSWACTGKIPVQPETDYVFSTNTSFVHVVYFSGDVGETFIERVNYANGYFTTPAECTYVAINLFGKGHTADDFNSAIDNAQLEIGQTASTYEAYTEQTVLRTEYIENSDVIESLGDATELVSRNLYDKTKAVSGKYISSGNIINGAACYTGFIPVKPNTQYCLSADKAVVDEIGMGFVTAISQFDANLTYTTQAVKSNAGTSNCLPFFTDADTHYVAVNFFLSQTWTDETFAAFIDTVMLEYGSNRGYEYFPYEQEMMFPTERLSNAGGLTPLSRWTGKKWISCGTSITWYDAHPYSAGLHTGEVCRGYQSHVCKALGLQLTNDGISGATLCNKSSSSFINRYTAIDWTGYDLVTIEFGVNDFGSAITVGEASEAANTVTFAGCLKTVIEYILAQNPTIRLVICTDPDVRGSTNNSNSNILEDFTKVTIDVAKQYRLPVCDWFYNSGISEYTRGSSTLDYLTADGTHPNDAGHERMGYELIKTLLY